MNIRRRLMERRAELMSKKQEELVGMVMDLERNRDVQIKANAIYKQRLSFSQNMHHKMNNLKPILERESDTDIVRVFYKSKRIASR